MIGCDHFSTPSLEPWREEGISSDSVPAITMDLLKEAIRRAEDDVQRRRQTEYLLWTNSEHPLTEYLQQLILLFTKSR